MANHERRLVSLEQLQTRAESDPCGLGVLMPACDGKRNCWCRTFDLGNALKQRPSESA